MDLTNGLMVAVPTPGGKAPAIDGSLRDWDLSAAEPIVIAPATAKQLNADVALMYDADALYVGARVSLPDRRLHNPNSPIDAFWWGDMMELRVAADPALPYPLGKGGGGATSTRIAHLSFWKNSETGSDYVHFAYGLDPLHPVGGSAVNPPGTSLVITVNGTTGYIVEARIPWANLNVPGGKNPFAGSSKMTAVWGVHWGGENQTAALYNANPGSFAFHQPQTWGQVSFSPAGKIAPRHGTMADALVAAQPQAVAVGVPFTIDIPTQSKVSVNIFGPHGEVIRELLGGVTRPKGKLTLTWDGRDQWGASVPPGKYRWGAYLSPGLVAQYVGNVGTSSTPPYPTLDNKGMWGADHSDPIDVAADATGLYFLWPSAESSAAVVKTDYSGTVLWRKTPFVGGGFGPHYAIAANGINVFLTFENAKVNLVKLDAATGRLLAFPDGLSMEPVTVSQPAAIAARDAAVLTSKGLQPDGIGLAATATEVFLSSYSQNRILVIDPATGKQTRTLDCVGPRGVALDTAGNVYAASFVPAAGDKTATGQVVRFDAAAGTGKSVVASGLVSPWDVAVDCSGRIHVTDLGDSQQVKVFSPAGDLVATLGKKGGRPWTGAYDGDSYLRPSGIAADMRDGIVVAETSAPKVITRRDASTDKLLARWFGDPAYSSPTVADPDDPAKVYYSLSMHADLGFARAKLVSTAPLADPAKALPSLPSAYWMLPEAGYPASGTLFGGYGCPEALTGTNGRKYLAADGGVHGIVTVDGDTIKPVGYANPVNGAKGERRRALELWSDTNGDGIPQPDELVTLAPMIDGTPISFADCPGSMHMEPNGDLYLTTFNNAIFRIPATGFAANGAVKWDASRADFVVPSVLPSLAHYMVTAPRAGVLGVRLDSAGNLYTCFNAKVYTKPGQSREFAYATDELAKQMNEGLGHSGESNAVKFAKYDSTGKLLWLAGRKATASPQPGEMYHFWVLGGLVGKPGSEYVAGSSEWGQIYFYTHDGFYVDALMNDSALVPQPGPYTFGSETFSGRVQYYPKRDEVWVYSCARVFKVAGFKNGRIDGEKRLWGDVVLDRVYDTAMAPTAAAQPLQIVPVAGSPLTDAASWNAAPSSTLSANGATLATAQLGYDAQYLYAKLHVADASPAANSADGPLMAFKGGDAAGFVLGAPSAKGATSQIRVLAAMVQGKPRVIAWKPVTALAKSPQDYSTPSGGTAHFEFAGEVPGGSATLTPDADGRGYTALIAVPRSFLEIPLIPGGTLAADVEVLLSGAGPRGMQAVSRNYLFSPRRNETTMTDDLPTEARLYPQFWGTATVK